MTDAALRRLTGVAAMASVAVWLAIFPLYTLGDPAVTLTRFIPSRLEREAA